MADTDRRTEGEVLERTDRATDKPRLFKVILHNDDYTTMDFVIDVLESIFNKSPAEAYRIMMQVHRDGSGVGGIYPYEVAETKTALAYEQARAEGHPLRVSMEEA